MLAVSQEVTSVPHEDYRTFTRRLRCNYTASVHIQNTLSKATVRVYTYLIIITTVQCVLSEAENSAI